MSLSLPAPASPVPSPADQDEEASFAAVPVEDPGSPQLRPDGERREAGEGSWGSTTPAGGSSPPPVLVAEGERFCLSEAILSKPGFMRSHLSMLLRGKTPRGAPAARTPEGEIIVPNCSAKLFRMLLQHVGHGNPLEEVDLANIPEFYERLLHEIITWKLPRFPLTLPTRLWTSSVWTDLSAFYVLDGDLLEVTEQEPVAIQVANDPIPTSIEVGCELSETFWDLGDRSPGNKLSTLDEMIDHFATSKTRIQSWRMVGGYWVLLSQASSPTKLLVKLPDISERVAVYEFPPSTNAIPESEDFPFCFFTRRDGHLQVWFSNLVGLEVTATRQTNTATGEEHPVRLRIRQTSKVPAVSDPSNAPASHPTSAVTSSSPARSDGSANSGPKGTAAGGASEDGVPAASSAAPSSASASTGGLGGWINLTGRAPVDVKPKWICYHPELSTPSQPVRYASTTKFNNGTKQVAVSTLNPTEIRFYPWGCLVIPAEIGLDICALLLINDPDLAKLYGPSMTVHLQVPQGMNGNQLNMHRENVDVAVTPDLSRVYLLISGQLASQPISPTSNKITFELAIVDRLLRAKLCYIDIPDGGPFKAENGLGNLGLLATYDPATELYYQAPIARALCPRFQRVQEESQRRLHLS